MLLSEYHDKAVKMLLSESSIESPIESSIDTEYGIINACCENCGSYGPVEYRTFTDLNDNYSIWLCENC